MKTKIKMILLFSIMLIAYLIFNKTYAAELVFAQTTTGDSKFKCAVNETSSIGSTVHFKDDDNKISMVNATSFKSDNESIAKVDASGTVTGVSVGNTNITATYTYNSTEYTATQSFEVYDTNNILDGWDFYLEYENAIKKECLQTAVGTDASIKLFGNFSHSFGISEENYKIEWKIDDESIIKNEDDNAASEKKVDSSATRKGNQFAQFNIKSLKAGKTNISVTIQAASDASKKITINIPVEATVAEELGGTSTKFNIENKYIGDLNCDGKLDTIDLIYLKKYLLGLIGDEFTNNFNSKQDFEKMADLNCDNKISSADLLILKKCLIFDIPNTIKYENENGEIVNICLDYSTDNKYNITFIKNDKSVEVYGNIKLFMKPIQEQIIKSLIKKNSIDTNGSKVEKSKLYLTYDNSDNLYEVNDELTEKIKEYTNQLEKFVDDGVLIKVKDGETYLQTSGIQQYYDMQ